MIHDLTYIEGRLRLTDDISHHRVRDELSELRSEIWDDLSLLSVSHLRVGMIPPGSDDRIFQSRTTLSLEVVVRK